MSQDEILCSISFDELLYDRCIEHARVIDYRLEHEMLDAVEDRLNKQGWFKERTCTMDKAYWDDGQSTWGCKCSSCGNRFEYETGIAWDYCPNCGARVEAVSE